MKNTLSKIFNYLSSLFGKSKKVNCDEIETVCEKEDCCKKDPVVEEKPTVIVPEEPKAKKVVAKKKTAPKKVSKSDKKSK
jgi:hypothetical protein